MCKPRLKQNSTDCIAMINEDPNLKVLNMPAWKKNPSYEQGLIR
jgi:hypothetical protein